MNKLTVSTIVALGLSTSLGFVCGYLFYAGFGEARNIAVQTVFEAQNTQRVLQSYEPVLITSRFYTELAAVKSAQDAEVLRQKYRDATLRNISLFEKQAAKLELPKERALAAPFLDSAANVRKELETK